MRRWALATFVAIVIAQSGCTGVLSGDGEDLTLPAPPAERERPALDGGAPSPEPLDAGALAPEPADAAPAPPPVEPPDAGETTCTPPAATGRLAMGETLPAYSWSAAYGPGAARTSFDLRDFHCDDARWGAYTSLLIVVGTAWCPNCPDYLRDVAALDLDRTGTLVLWVESQNSSYESATSDEALRTVDRVIGQDAAGLRLGERDNSMRDAIGSRTSTVPAGYFVRRRDMRILADENELGVRPPWQEMSRDPELDWESRLRGGGGSTCGAADEEAFEPNDTSATAASIAPGSFTGGVCASQPDWYRVSIAGRWRLDLQFSHASGDLDVYVLDDSGATIARSDSATDDESVTVTGPARVRIEGWRGATAPYRLTLTEL
jgi:hypothetical protein